MQVQNNTAMFSSISSYFKRPRLLDNAKFSIINENFTIKSDELGRGSYGIVYAAEYYGKPCVAKELHAHLNQHNTPEPLEDLYKEINTLASLKHPSIVQFLGVHFRSMSTPPILVMERMWKSLSDVLAEQPNQLSLFIKTHILYDVACGLQYLHGQNKPVIHRNLRASNILLNENKDAKITDLGQAKALEKLSVLLLSKTPQDLTCIAQKLVKKNQCMIPVWIYFHLVALSFIWLLNNYQYQLTKW